MDSKKIIDHFKNEEQQFSYLTSFKKVQEGLEWSTTLTGNRYDAVAFECLCSKMDRITKSKNEGDSLEEVLDGILPNTILETYYNGSPSDPRTQPFHYLASIVAAKHIFADTPDVAKICGAKFTQAVQQMIADGRDYHDGCGGGPLRDCRNPEETGKVLEDMQEGFDSQLGENLRAEGLGPVIEVAQETIECTDSLKPYFKNLRRADSKLLPRSLFQKESDATAEALNGFNPFTVDPVQ